MRSISVVQSVQQNLQRGIFKDDPFFFVKKIEGGDGADIVKWGVLDSNIGVIYIYPLFGIYGHIFVPLGKIFIDVDVYDLQPPLLYHIPNNGAVGHHINNLFARCAPGI